MVYFCKVKGLEENGLGKVIDERGNKVLVEYFDAPTVEGRVTQEVLQTNVQPTILGRNTRIYAYDEFKDLWRVGRVLEDDSEGLLIRFAHHVDQYLSYEQVHVRWRRPIQDPLVFLAMQITETPMYAEARSCFMESYIAQRGASQGMSALLSSAIELEAHQIDVIQRVISDPSQRYLLADEVGLGKTIEAGVIIRQAVLDDPVHHRIVIVVPRTLVAQWRYELVRRFGLRDFLDESVLVLPQEDKLELAGALRGATMLVIDEAHHVAAVNENSATATLYEMLRQAAQKCPRLLLLSATPVLRNESGFLRMLHLLDPVVYSLKEETSFKLKIQHRQALAETVAELHPSQAYFLDGYIDDLMIKLPNDERLCELVQQLKVILATEFNEEDEEFVDALRHLRSHISETYRLSRRILRNRRRQVPGLTPDRNGIDGWVARQNGFSNFEASLESWRISANAFLPFEEENGRRELAQFYFQLMQTALEDPTHISDCCRRRIDTIRHQITTPVFTFEGEDSLLTDIVAHSHAEDWIQSRLTALSNHIRQLPANGKAVIFCTSSEVADEIVMRLKSDHVAAVRHTVPENEDADNVPEWMRFLTDATVRVIVCDREAEEGINLQGGKKAVVHFDLPMQPNRIEQRIGRTDRYGSGTAVHSYAVVDEDSKLQNLWLQVLTEGWGVFDHSISSLQYIVETEITELVDVLFRDGSEALEDLLQRLQGPKGLVATELKLIDQQDALDELAPASEDAIEPLFDLDFEWKDIRHAMLHWICDTLFFEKVPEKINETVTDVPQRFQYRPPEPGGQATLIPLLGFLYDFLGAIDFEAPGGSSSRPRSYPHTANRATAVRRGVRLLRYGDEFVEAVKSFSEVDDRGRSFAMWRQIHEGFPHQEMRLCFRFDFLVQADLKMAGAVLISQTKADISASDQAVLQRRADALFPPQMCHVWLDGDGEELPAEFVDAFLSQSYAKEGNAGYIDKNLEQNHFEALKKIAPHFFENWSQRCIRTRDAAYALMSQQTSLQDRIRFALKRARDQDSNRYAQLITRAQSLDGAEAVAEQAQLVFEKSLNGALYTGIQVPSIQLDVAGVVLLTSESVATLKPLIVNLI